VAKNYLCSQSWHFSRAPRSHRKAEALLSDIFIKGPGLELQIGGGLVEDEMAPQVKTEVAF